MHNKYIYILNDKNSNTAVTLPNRKRTDAKIVVTLWC